MAQLRAKNLGKEAGEVGKYGSGGHHPTRAISQTLLGDGPTMWAISIFNAQILQIFQPQTPH